MGELLLITMTPFIWLGLLVFFLVIEALTVSLVSIWMAGGAFVALILSLLDVGIWPQIWAFLITSILLLVLTRPIAIKYINTKRIRTNADELIGKTAKVTGIVDNIQESGTVVVNGKEWTARTELDGEILQPRELAEIVKISGVKLIIRKKRED